MLNVITLQNADSFTKNLVT